jgi:glycosyltransferase involved in cell wall biosynthesis
MKILHSIATLDFSHGGPVRAVIDLSEALAGLGHQVRVMTSSAPDTPQDWKRPGSPTTAIELGPRQRLGAWYAGDALDRIRREVADADVVHIHGVWTPHNTQVAKAARQNNTPYVLSCRGMLDDWCMDQRRLKKLFYLRFAGGSAMLNNAAGVHCTADGELRQSGKWFPGSPGTVIPNLLDLRPYETLPGVDDALARFPTLNDPEPTLLFLSRLHYKKGVEHLIEAAALLRDRGRPHRVIIAGTGDDDYERTLKALVAERRLGDLVTFPGMVIGREKVSLYQACDLFVLPTSQENFGFVLYEALAAGTTLITTRGVDTWPELEEAGATITEQHAPTLADAIERLTGDAENLARLGEQGRAWVFANLQPDGIVRRFCTLYEDAVAAG